MFYVDKRSGLYSPENYYGENGIEVDAPIEAAGAYSLSHNETVVLSADYSEGKTIGLIRYEP